MNTRLLADRSPVLTLEQAQELCAYARTLAARIRRRVGVAERLDHQVLVLRMLTDASANGQDFQEFVDKSVRYHKLRGQVDAVVEQLAHLGCVVRNHDASHLDYTYLRDDGLAYFCWRPDEARIEHWHYMHEDHDERRPLHHKPRHARATQR